MNPPPNPNDNGPTGASNAKPASAQQNGSPPPKYAGDGPNLEVTMKFIQDKLTDQAKINYMEYLTDNTTGQTWVVPLINETTKVIANPGICSINYHQRLPIRDGVTERDFGLNLKDVQTIVVMSWDVVVNKDYKTSGHPEFSTKSDPPIFALQARLPQNAVDSFLFYDEDLANRVAKAMVHAVELCGGGSKPEPF